MDLAAAAIAFTLSAAALIAWPGVDMLKHPLHVACIAGIFLLALRPVRSIVSRDPAPSALVRQLPAIVGLAAIMELVHWGTQYAFLSGAESSNAVVEPANMPSDVLTLLSQQYYAQGIGLLSAVMQSATIVGVALFALHRLRLAGGALVTLMLLGNVAVAAADAGHAAQFWAVVAASLVAGACGEAFALSPGASAARFAAFSFAIPAAYWATLLLVLSATMGGLWWSPDIVAGSVLFAGLTGVFVNEISAWPAWRRPAP